MVLQITPWERDALQLLAAGVADDDIAAVLGVSKGTVNSYLAYLFENLGVTSRRDAVVAATRRGLVRLIECAEHRECLPLLPNERPAGMRPNRDRDVAGVSRRGPVDERGTLRSDPRRNGCRDASRKRQKRCLRKPSN